MVQQQPTAQRLRLGAARCEGSARQIWAPELAEAAGLLIRWRRDSFR
jgi:hypothetical protein